MSIEQTSLSPFYAGWDHYQQHLLTVIAPLTAEQLALRGSEDHWSIGMIATHIVATRVGWFHDWMGAGKPELALMSNWDEDDQPLRTTPEIITGLQQTWQMIQEELASHTPDDLSEVFFHPYRQDTPRRSHSRQWIIWHVLEHDIHHGTELSFALSIHGLPCIDL